MKAVIATSATVNAERWDSFISAVKEAFPEVSGMSIQTGPGCTNFGVYISDEIPEDERKSVMDGLTMALMPARWANTPDSDPSVKDGEYRYGL